MRSRSRASRRSSRDVAAHGVDAALVGDRRPVEQPEAAVLAKVAVLEGERGEAVGQLAHLRRRAGEVVGMHEVGEHAADHLLLAPAEQARRGRVHGADQALEVADEHDVLRDPPQPVAVPGLLHLGELLVVDVGVRADPARHLAVVGADRHSADEMPAIFAIVAADAELGFVDRSGRKRRRPVGEAPPAGHRDERCSPSPAPPAPRGPARNTRRRAR